MLFDLSRWPLQRTYVQTLSISNWQTTMFKCRRGGATTTTEMWNLFTKSPYRNMFLPCGLAGVMRVKTRGYLSFSLFPRLRFSAALPAPSQPWVTRSMRLLLHNRWAYQPYPGPATDLLFPSQSL